MIAQFIVFVCWTAICFMAGHLHGRWFGFTAGWDANRNANYKDRA